MAPPKELPGFYFDPEKNRYFPIKGPIPGIKRPSTASTSSSSDQNKRHHALVKRKRIDTSSLLHSRELHGQYVISKRCRYNFAQEYEKLQVAHPLVWKYPETTVSCRALEQMHGKLQTAKGLKESYLLLAGNVNFSIRLYKVGKIGQWFDSGFECTPKPIWPILAQHEEWNYPSLASIWCSSEVTFSSDVSCIRGIGRRCPSSDEFSSFQRTLVTTLGSGVSRGSVHILNLTKPLDYDASAVHLRKTSAIASFNNTIWTADCNSNGTRAVIGTNSGASLIDLETRASSWVYRTRSDILSQQFDHSGNIVLCGQRNGAIIAVDVRQKQSRCLEVSSTSLTTSGVRKVVCPPPVRHDKMSTKQKSEIKNTSTSGPFLSSSVCSLVALQSDDQYFLGSSMDGSIKLFDRRLLQRGAVQSYEGHVNSHSYLQLGVNPSETLLLSGGEDCCVRIWSLKSSDLLFEENVSNSIISTVCWRRGMDGDLMRQSSFYEDNPLELNHSHGAWLGSCDGIHYMHVN